MKDENDQQQPSAFTILRSSFVLWVAQGFGVGRIPFAPGTFGSVLGLGWFALLLLAGNSWIYLGGTLVGLGASVWLCGIGEKILNRKDPGSIVLDEIAAIPICFGAWLALKGGTAAPQYFFSQERWPLTAGVLVVFRIFDVWKPWPVRQSQSLSGGWGVTTDDALAALYVNLCFLLCASTQLIHI